MNTLPDHTLDYLDRIEAGGADRDTHYDCYHCKDNGCNHCDPGYPPHTVEGWQVANIETEELYGPLHADQKQADQYYIQGGFYIHPDNNITVVEVLSDGSWEY